ncbi:MAG: geranylgeranyl reductase family protein [Candidatus Aenigmarchaeota archaeon]|nr:geranylgeranyl reductase family protein [Candidatus Aenigmarchaeota archaeon]
MEEYKVIVVGAGPAGSSCAIFLGRKGIKNLLVDKAAFPREKTCGDGITGNSVDVLKELGVEDEIIKVQHENIRGLITSAPSGAAIDMSVDNGMLDKPLYVCKRQIFDNILFEEAKKNADVMENFTVNDLITENGKVVGIKGVDKSGAVKEFRAKIIVGADGANSIVARKLGLNEFQTDRSLVSVRAYFENVEVSRDRIEFHFLEELLPGYFWIFPAGNNVSNVGVAVVAGDVPKRKLNLKTSLEYIVKNSRFASKFKNAKQVSEIKGWNLPTGAQKRKRAGDGFLLIGDAASLIDPFTGEGIGNALTSGKLASQVVISALEKDDFSYGMLKQYETEIDNHMEGVFRSSYKFQKFGKNALMFNALVEELGTNKGDMKIATSAFSGTALKKTSFQIPIGLYLRVFVRYLKSYLKSKIKGKNKPA